MATGDFADLKTKTCRSAHFNPNSSTDLARAGEAVNEANLFVSSQSIHWDFLMKEGTGTFTASTDLYSYEDLGTAMGETNDIEEVIAFYNDTDGGLEIEGMSWEAVERFALNTQETSEGTGDPIMFGQWNRQVRFYPNPQFADTFRCLYKFTPPLLTSDGDTPLVPLSFRMSCLVPYAAAILLEQEGGGEAMNDYERRMNRFEKAFVELRSSHGSARAPAFRVKEPSFLRNMPVDHLGRTRG